MRRRCAFWAGAALVGVAFGLIPQPPEEPGGDWSVVVEPGNVMCFWPPWASGDYDT